MTDIVLPESEIPVGRARAALMRRLIDVVAMPASRVTLPDRHMASDILLDMLFEASDDQRQRCAKRLQNTAEAPRRLMRYLAQCKLDVANYLIAENMSFDSSDLCDIIEMTGTEHQLVIAARRNLTPPVSGALINTGDASVVRALLSNTKAEISETAIDTIVTMSQQNEDFCALLVARSELTPSQAMAMFWWSDGPTRRTILTKYAADRMVLVDLCSDVFAIMQDDDWKDPIARTAIQMIERRQRNRAALDRSDFESLEAAISIAAATGMTPPVMQEIGYLAGVRPVCAAKLMSDLGGEGMAILCKATGLKRPSLIDLWAAMRRPVRLDDGSMHPQLKYVIEIFDTTSVMKAQTVLRYWNWSLTAAGPSSVNAANDSDDSDVFSASKRAAKLVFGS